MNLNKIMGIAMTAALLACNTLVWAASVEPVTVRPWSAGDAATECAQAGGCGDFAFKIEKEKEVSLDGVYLPEEGNVITIYDSSDTTLSWTSDWPVCTVIVKGGPDANVYYYPEGSFGDTGLVSPTNPNNNQPYGISHVTFCYNEPEVCWEGETAWADGERYEDTGNWATYTEYVADGVVTLYAGQEHVAGVVTFSAPDNGFVKICILLNPGFRFADVEENVKIQDYLNAPSGNPQIGQFDWKGNADQGESIFCIDVSLNNFYGVHVDVERAVVCPDETED